MSIYKAIQFFPVQQWAGVEGVKYLRQTEIFSYTLETGHSVLNLVSTVLAKNIAHSLS